MSKLQQQCDQFNARHKVGDTVAYWSGPREGKPREGVIRFGAQIMGGHSAVVYIEGKGAISLSHVEGDLKRANATSAPPLKAHPVKSEEA